MQEGGAAYKRGDYSAAASQFEAALIEAKAFRQDDSRLAGTLNSLADSYKKQHRYAEAEPLYKNSLAILEKALGPEDRLIAVVSVNLGELYRAQLRYAEAELLYRRALTVMEKVHGAEHPSVAAILTTYLADLYRAQARYDEVERLYRRSLTIVEKALGPEHSSTGIALRDLAEIYVRLGRPSEAEPLYKRSLAIFEKALGSVHPTVRMTLADLASVYDEQGRHEEAEVLRKRSIAISDLPRKREPIVPPGSSQPGPPGTGFTLPAPPLGLPIPYQGAAFKPRSAEEEQYVHYLKSTPMFPDRKFCEETLSERLRTAAEPGSAKWVWVTDPFLSWGGRRNVGAIVGPVEYLFSAIEAHVDFRDLVRGRDQRRTFSCFVQYATFEQSATWQAGHLKYGVYINAGHKKYATGLAEILATAPPGTATRWDKEVRYYQKD